MTTSILVEPCQAGFRAITGGPLDLSAAAASAAEALVALQAKINSRFEHGAILVDHSVRAVRSPGATASTRGIRGDVQGRSIDQGMEEVHESLSKETG